MLGKVYGGTVKTLFELTFGEKLMVSIVISRTDDAIIGVHRRGKMWW